MTISSGFRLTNGPTRFSLDHEHYDQSVIFKDLSRFLEMFSLIYGLHYLKTV